MIIDIHTHTFPAEIAQRALHKLSSSSNLPYYTNGTLEALEESMQRNGIDASVLLPVVTNPKHSASINALSIDLNTKALEKGRGIFAFGGIHPDNENYREILRELHNQGVLGIKLHPVYQGYDFDDIKYKRIIDCAMEEDMFVLTHAGYDVGYPGHSEVAPEHIIPVLRDLKPEKLILAHMGAWDCWEKFEEMLSICPFYIDTAFSISDELLGKKEVYPAFGAPKTLNEINLSPENFVKLVKMIGCDRVLFGSDSPWSDQGEYVSLIKNLSNYGLSQNEITQILGGNACRLLKLSSVEN